MECQHLLLLLLFRVFFPPFPTDVNTIPGYFVHFVPFAEEPDAYWARFINRMRMNMLCGENIVLFFCVNRVPSQLVHNFLLSFD